MVVVFAVSRRLVLVGDDGPCLAPLALSPRGYVPL